MTTRIHKATKTRSNRPGWSVTFNHPCHRRAVGKSGRKVRRGLGTTDDSEADRLVEQLNTLLADESWWSFDRRAEAERLFNKVVVSAFFDEIDSGKSDPKHQRDEIIPLPEGYARVMMLGSTGAGKTTLLRQLIGSDHTQDRFPSTSTAKTTTADIEIITAEGPFEAVVTFMTWHETRSAIEECLEEACARVIQGDDDPGVAGALLEHREQRFRLSYIIGTWQQESHRQEDDDQYAMEYEYEGETGETADLTEDETVGEGDLIINNERLRGYVARIREISTAVSTEVATEHDEFAETSNANQRQDWLENFTDKLYDNEDFKQLSLDIVEAVEERFALVESGAFEGSAAGWPDFWYVEENNRNVFLKQVRWFTGNHSLQFGRLLTPLVNGIRVCGAFQPMASELHNADRRLVLIDGEGLGHSAKEAMSISTKVTEKFSEVDMILLVDNAQSPMQAAPLELLRSVGSSGHAHKLAVAFTHFDQVQGDNLGNYGQKRSHVRASIGNAIASLRQSLGAPVTEVLERQLQSNDFYLGGLNQATERIPRGFIRDMKDLMERMQQSAETVELPDLAPIYRTARLELGLRDATDGFKNPWRGRLGIAYHEGTSKEHWTRVKALCRRIVNHGNKNEYDGLRPVADLIRQLQASISLWLDNPTSWTRPPENEDEQQAIINDIRQRVFISVHTLAERRLITLQRAGWRTAFEFSRTGSSYRRADRMAQIYEEAAPSVSSVMDTQTQAFLDEIIRIVADAVEDVGGSIEGVAKRETANVT